MRKLFVLILLAGCVNSRPEAISLLGKPLRAPELSSETRQERTAVLDAARRAWETNPESANAIIWLGRRTAYLGRYRDAIEIYSRGIALHPTDARLLRHRGHRYITIRDLERAVRDLSAAAGLVEGQIDHVEPDGLPNASMIPTSTLHFNICTTWVLLITCVEIFKLRQRPMRAACRFRKNADSVLRLACTT